MKRHPGTVYNLEREGKTITAYVIKDICTQYIDYDATSMTPDQILADLLDRGIEVTECGRNILFGHFLG